MASNTFKCPIYKGLTANKVHNTLLACNHSVVVNDIKGELFDQTAGYRATLGPRHAVLSHASSATSGTSVDALSAQTI